MSRQLFGTDGVRGRAGDFLTAELAVALARATVELGDDPHPQVLIVRDTRESGEMLEAAIAAGVTAAGGDVLLGGVLPTPAAPLLVRRHGLQLAAVISASHNPYEDNGIKFFAADGFKLSDETETAIENQMAAPFGPPRAHRSGAPAARRAGGLPARAARRASQALDLRAGGCCSTAPTAPPTGPRLRSSGGSEPRSR